MNKSKISDYVWDTTMRTCPICGKRFLPAPQHSWKINGKHGGGELVCRYSCMRKWETTHRDKRRAGI